MDNGEQRLSGNDAILKFKEIVEHGPMCLFQTRLGERPIPVRPMTVQQVCDQGNFWFLSSRSSMKDHDIAKDPEVQLLFANAARSEYLSVLGRAERIDDMAKKKELWSPLAKAWFPEGVEDPDLTVLKVVPSEGHYWDTKDGKAISLLKIAVAAVTGARTMDGGVQGRIAV